MTPACSYWEIVLIVITAVLELLAVLLGWAVIFDCYYWLAARIFLDLNKHLL